MLQDSLIKNVEHCNNRSMGCLYSAHVCMIRIPAVRQKGETDTIRTQLLYTIPVVMRQQIKMSDIATLLKLGCSLHALE